MFNDDECAREPIHIIGAIQPHGFLVAVSEPDFLVRHVSANLPSFIAKAPTGVVGHALADLFSVELVEKIRSDPSEDGFVTINPIHVELGSGTPSAYDGVIHRYNDMLILELEPQCGAYSIGGPLNLAKYLQNPIARIAGQSSIADIVQTAATEFQKITSYDRVMIYKFDPEWNGQVIAEAGTSEASLLWHQFPATDIPAQARRLFLINLMRSIVDIDAVPVQIIPEHDERNGAALDLSHSLLRSASPIHIQYLRNMGVQSSMTISLVVRGELWGMLTAHHAVAHRLDFLTRSVCELFGQTLSAHILARTDNWALEERIRSRARIESYMASVETSAPNSQSGPIDSLPLLDLLGATGAVSLVDGVYSQCGITIERDALMRVASMFRRQANHGIASSHRLADIDPAAAPFAHEVSGALFIGLSELNDDFILLLREEVVRNITWAGNPAKPTLRSEGSLTPRTSFAAWEESVRGSSLPWTELQIEKAQLLREQFRNTRLRQHLRARELTYEQQRDRSTILQEAILPPALPTVAGLSFDAIYDPGRSDDQVGGDWYDAVQLLDGRVIVTIGDVAGNGIKAAVIMGVVRQIMRGIGQLHADPALMLDAADRALRLEYPDIFATTWVGIVDLVALTLTYASAGHPPPLLVESTGEVRELDHRTLPIGLRQGHQGFASIISLSDASMLCLYTDGLIESTHNIIAGSQRLSDVVKRIGPKHLKRPAATIRRLVIPDGSADDVAILTVRVNLVDSEKCLTRSKFHSDDALSARKARHAFTRGLADADFSENDKANAEVVYGELCGNVTRYASGIVEVIVDRSGTQTVLHVLDRGIGFRHLSRLPLDILAENGRGLFIISSMTSEFTVSQRVGGGSHARAVLVGKYPRSLLREETLPALSDQISAVF